MIEYIPVVAPSVLISVIFYFVLNRIYKKLDGKQTKETCSILQTNLEKDLKDLKEQNGKIVDRLEEQNSKQVETATNVKWIKEHLENGGDK